jgi:hypothetical protein
MIKLRTLPLHHVHINECRSEKGLVGAEIGPAPRDKTRIVCNRVLREPKRAPWVLKRPLGACLGFISVRLGGAQECSPITQAKAAAAQVQRQK